MKLRASEPARRWQYLHKEPSFDVHSLYEVFNSTDTAHAYPYAPRQTSPDDPMEMILLMPWQYIGVPMVIYQEPRQFPQMLFEAPQLRFGAYNLFDMAQKFMYKNPH